LKRPSSIACTARSCERSAQRSCSSREMPSSRLTKEACSTMWRSSKVEINPSCTIESMSVPSPSR
jgi:hypothetical protein